MINKIAPFQNKQAEQMKPSKKLHLNGDEDNNREIIKSKEDKASLSAFQKSFLLAKWNIFFL